MPFTSYQSLPLAQFIFHSLFLNSIFNVLLGLYRFSSLLSLTSSPTYLPYLPPLHTYLPLPLPPPITPDLFHYLPPSSSFTTVLPISSTSFPLLLHYLLSLSFSISFLTISS